MSGDGDMFLRFADPPPDRATPINDELALLPFRLDILDAVQGDDDMLRVRIRVEERGTGLPIELVVTSGLDGEDRLHAVRTALLFVLAHELDECLVTRGGAQLRETHEADGTSTRPRIPNTVIGEPDEPGDGRRVAIVIAEVDLWLKVFRDDIAECLLAREPALSRVTDRVKRQLEEAGL